MLLNGSASVNWDTVPFLASAPAFSLSFTSLCSVTLKVITLLFHTNSETNLLELWILIAAWLPDIVNER